MLGEIVSIFLLPQDEFVSLSLLKFTSPWVCHCSKHTQPRTSHIWEQFIFFYGLGVIRCSPDSARSRVRFPKYSRCQNTRLFRPFRLESRVSNLLFYYVTIVNSKQYNNIEIKITFAWQPPWVDFQPLLLYLQPQGSTLTVASLFFPLSDTTRPNSGTSDGLALHSLTHHTPNL